MPRESGADIVREAVLRVLADQTEADAGKRHGRGDEPHSGREQKGGNEDRVRH
jgi:hypothetical protein